MNPVEEWILDIAPVTRYWMGASILVALLVQCNVISFYQLYFTFTMVFNKGQYWRLITTFLVFGNLSLDLGFRLFFMSRYSRMVEESHYRDRPFAYLYLLMIGSIILLILSPLTSSLVFLGPPLSTSIIYLWCRRNPTVDMSFLGLFIFKAAYLPWILCAISLLMRNGQTPISDLLGILVGHIWFFFEDIFPRLIPGDVLLRPLSPPWEWQWFTLGNGDNEE